MSFLFQNWFPRFLVGSWRADTLTGSDRTDIIIALGGDDVIQGLGGNDIIQAGHGDDLIDPGSGSDHVDGGRGFDTVVYQGGIGDYAITMPSRWSPHVTVSDLSNGDRDWLRGVEALYFTADDYTLHLDGTNNAVLARDDAFSTGENDPLAIDAAELTANDSEFDGDPVTLTDVSATSTLGATVSLLDGIVTYDQGDLFDALREGESLTDSFTYTVDDGFGGVASATVSITIGGVNDAPVFTSADNASLEENASGAALTAEATDVDGDTVTYSIAGGADAALFAIDAATGELSFIASPDFESPADADADNQYEVTIGASDEHGGSSTQDILITVTDVDEAPPAAPRINEFHYDNAGTDTGEFIEIRVGKDADVSGLSVELYNGSGGSMYGSAALASMTKTGDADFDYYVWELPENGLQNGAPDGIALIEGASVVEFLSYEGEFTATGGTASGMTSTDIGVAETSSTAAGLSLQRSGDGPTDWTGPVTATVGAANDEPGAVEARINEIHYDNAGADTGEFVEVRVSQGADVGSMALVLYNGSNGAAYGGAHALAGNLAGSDSDYDYYVLNIAGIQNGSPDGLALVNGSHVVEFLSYEGAFTAVDGPAAGMVSVDIGVAEDGSDAAGLSLQRVGDGPTEWDEPRDATAGGANDGATTPLVVNEIAVSTAGTDWEFVELFGEAGTALDGYSLLQVDGDGDVLAAIGFDGQSIGDNGYFLAASAQAGSTFGVTPDLEFSNNTFTNVSASYLLVRDFTGSSGSDLDADDDGVIDAGHFASVIDSVAVIGSDSPLVYSSNVVGPDGTFLAAGAARTPEGDGPFEMTSFSDSSGYTPTAGGGTGGTPTPHLISQIQGTGSASLLVGDYVLVSAVVTYTVGNGFFLQEESTDSDGNPLSSEGIFVFTGGAPSVAVGDLVEVSATVAEYFGLTELTDVISIDTISSGNALPDYTDVTLPLASADALEQFEGMRVSLTSGTADPITVIETYNLDRYGDITLSAGNQVQPTQIYDPDTDAAEIAALIEANALNRLIIDDGISAQNPDSFAYIPASIGDNGNGYLDSGDDFSAAGPTIRLGAEIDAPVEGVLTYGFDAYRMHVDGTLSIDETTNGGARTDSPEDVGGTLKVASFNLLNFFTTLNNGTGGSGPNDLEPRGAATAADLERQLDKIVASMLAIDADVFGLQELENNGFGSTSAIRTLVDALNDALGSEVYAFVDPTGGVGDGFIGTDAITTGVIYKTTALTVVGSDYLVFDDGGQQLSRPSIAVSFQEIASGEVFNVAVNHFKSKGASGLTDTSDPNYDQGDGQGFWNAARTAAAIELAEWLATDPTGSGDLDTLIIGDLNSYAQEDPVDALRDAGFLDLIDQFIGQENAYSYVFSGQRGTLDQGLASTSLASQITGLTEWHINADEPDLLSYSSQFNDPGFYSPDVFATSDHDPLIIGLDLGVVAV